MIERVGSLIVLSGPSGVGKSTLVKRVRENMGNLEFSVSCTTRSPRPGEEHGREYYFLSPEEFEKRFQNGEFIETAQVFAHRYGTLKSEVASRIKRGAPLLLDIDVQGAAQIRKAAQQDEFLNSVLQFILIAPPNIEVLENRLRSRGSETLEQLELRLSGAKRELASFRLYDYVVVNDNLDTAVGDLLKIIDSARLRTALIQGSLFHE